MSQNKLLEAWELDLENNAKEEDITAIPRYLLNSKYAGIDVRF